MPIHVNLSGNSASLVPKGALQSVIARNSIRNNDNRVIGPALAEAIALGSSVMTMIAYDVPAHNHAHFIELMYQRAHARKRSGAYSWGIMQDTEHPDQFSEYFLETSWLSHLPRHERVVGVDRLLQAEVRKLVSENTKPVVTHLLGVVKLP